MSWAAWVVVGVIALALLDRLALLAEARGWIYWRRRTPARSTAGMALQNLQAIFEPQIHHVVEERSQIGADQPGDDEPPDPA